MTDSQVIHSLGTLAELPLELREEIFSYLPDLVLTPVFSRTLGFYWPRYILPSELLPISRQIQAELRNVTSLLSNKYPPTLIVKLAEIEWADEFIPLIQMARGFDLAWLKTHDPSKETEKVAKWVLDHPIQYFQRIKAGDSRVKMRWVRDTTAPEWQNLREFLQACLLRLRINWELEFRILLMPSSGYAGSRCVPYWIRHIAVKCGYETESNFLHFVTLVQSQGMPSPMEVVLEKVIEAYTTQRYVRVELASNQEMDIVKE